MLNLCYGSLQWHFLKKKRKIFEMRSCIIFQGASPVGMVLEDYIWWRYLDLLQICPFCLSGAVSVELPPQTVPRICLRELAQMCRARGQLIIKLVSGLMFKLYSFSAFLLQYKYSCQSVTLRKPKYCSPWTVCSMPLRSTSRHRCKAFLETACSDVSAEIFLSEFLIHMEFGKFGYLMFFKLKF